MADETRRVMLEDEDGSAPPTRRVALEALSTRRVADEEHLPTPTEHHLPRGILAPGTVLCGDCVVEDTLYPHESQRPGLYRCSSPMGPVIVKIYAMQYPPKQELWQRLPYLNHPHVLRTHRICEADGYYYEVQDYCDGGSLERRVPKPGSGIPPVSAEWISNVMLPQVCEGLRYLHSQEIIHRDIKPANIYVKCSEGRERLVLADFDISSVLEETRTSRDTQRAGGTWLYTAPEAFPRFVDDHASTKRGRVSRSCDYYSLGLTIIELVIGTSSLHLCELPDLFDFYLQGGRVEIPQGIPGRLPILLRGLLIRNRQTRWGADEVARWLANANTDDDLRRIQEDDYFELARASRPYRLNTRDAVDLPSLAEAMFREPEVAKEDLITGDILLNWIGALNPTLAREIRRDRDRDYMRPELVLHQTIMRCDPTRPYIFADGTEATTAAAWISHAIQLARTGAGTDALCSDEVLEHLEAWLRLKITPQPELADRVALVKKTPARVRLEELAYLFQSDTPYTIMRGVQARTPQEIARLTYGAADDWQGKRPACYDASYQRWFDGALCAWLRQRGLDALAAQCDDIRAKLGEETFAAFETVLRLLDPALPPVQVELDTSELARARAIPYGATRVCHLRYTTRGCGVPFAAVTAPGTLPGLALREQIIRQRTGTIEVVFDTHQGMQAFKTYQAELIAESGVAQLTRAPMRFSYRMIYPTTMTVLRLLAGAGIGIAVFGLPRLVASAITGPRLIRLPGQTLVGFWEKATGYDFPLLGVAIAFLLFIVLLYFGVRLLIRAIRGSEI